MTGSGSRYGAGTLLAAPLDYGTAQAVLAIGRPEFPRALMSSLRRVADVDHCMVFSFDASGAARCRLDLGAIPTGSELGEAYSGHFHTSDPNRDVMFAPRARQAPIVLPTFAGRMYSRGYRKFFFEDSGIVDKFATAIWVDATCYYVNFYRIAASGGFNRPQVDRLRRLAPAVGAAVARHLDATAPGQSPRTPGLGELFATSPALAALTAREREVCLRILSGQSSEAISADLGISIHSTLTYRRRAYQRLGISSQNELFALVLRLLTQPDTRLN
jgi:DNA-binding CsgD family transcriptional regulator